jgi:UDP-N-acetylglucosamine 1-carboxyvinyltransferase
MPDRIETGTYLAAAAANGGRIRLVEADAASLDADAPEAARSRRAHYRQGFLDRARKWPAAPPRSGCAPRLIPGFATDMQAQFMALACVADGTAGHRDHFRKPLHARLELQRLGADIRIQGNTAVVRGVERLQGAR